MTDSKRILMLKEEAESYYQSFDRVAKELKSMGFDIGLNPDLTVYVFKNVQELYGEIKAIEKSKPSIEEVN